MPDEIFGKYIKVIPTVQSAFLYRFFLNFESVLFLFIALSKSQYQWNDYNHYNRKTKERDDFFFKKKSKSKVSRLFVGRDVNNVIKSTILDSLSRISLLFLTSQDTCSNLDSKITKSKRSIKYVKIRNLGEHVSLETVATAITLDKLFSQHNVLEGWSEQLFKRGFQ